MHYPLEFGPHALAQAVEQCPISVVITDLEGRIEYVNAWFTKVTGYTREEALGQNPRILKSGYTSREEYQQIFAALQEGKTWRGEFRNRRKNGELYWEEAVIVPVKDYDGNYSQYMALKTDVTARKEAEAAQDTMINLLSICNQASNRRDLLGGVARFLQSVTGALMVTASSSSHASGDRPLSETAGELAKNSPQAQELVFPLILAGSEMGSLRLFFREQRQLKDSETRHYKEIADTVAMSVAKFVSEEALLESQQRLRDMEKMEAIGQLAGGVAHDYNNILTATLLHLAMLQEESQLPADVRATLAEIELETKRAAKLTRQLLLFSRRQPVRFGPVDLQGVANNLRTMLGRVLGEDLHLDIPAGAGEAWIDGDPGMMEQVIMNLCLNARDAVGPRGGSVRVRVDCVLVGKAEAARNPKARPGRHIRLRVTDNGSGMDAATKARIFEPFFTTKGEGSGTGLGPSTVYSIVERHEGWIEVDSEVGRGTEFRVFFAQRAITPSGEPTDLAESSHNGKGELILLVEDNPMVRATSASALRLHGYQVVDVPDGPNAIRIWEKRGKEIAMLLTDLIMPGGLNGQDLILRFRNERPELPVLVMSGYGVLREGLGSLILPGVTQMAKPCELHELIRVVSECLEGRSVGEK